MADPGARDLAEAATRLAGARVLVVGDVMLDRFVHGEVARISPEAPVPVFRVTGETAMPGGAGNVARNAAALGAAVTLVGVVGSDDEGRALAAMLANEAGVSAHLVAEVGRPTTTKTRHVAGGQQLLRADRETTAPIDATTADRVVATAVKSLTQADVLVLSDYAKGVLTDDVLARLIAAAAGKPVVVDPKSRDLRRYAGATVLTPNRAELAASVAHSIDDDASIAEAAQGALNAASVGALLVTRGSDGMTLVTRAGAVEHLPTAAREVYDVAGAGDTVTAVLGAALGVGLPLATAARLANIAAGIVVGKRGTAVVHPDELAHALRERALLDAESKVVGLATAQGIVEAWRRGGQRVAFTNGCFDLLHPGHIGLLSQAKAAGDRLVVGLNTDAGVTRLKGPGRPVQSDVARAQVLASLAVVDLVVVFEEDTPIKLIEALRPEVLVKGADYRLDEVVGADQVARWGGRVVLVDLTPGYSTTETIKRLGR